VRYQRIENFQLMDINDKSYYFDIEKETIYSRLHGVIRDGKYLISNDKSKHFFKSPNLSDFEIILTLVFLFLTMNQKG